MGVTAILASLLVPVNPGTVVAEETIAEIVTAESVKKVIFVIAI